jgi:HlyD family secretion protein
MSGLFTKKVFIIVVATFFVVFALSLLFKVLSPEQTERVTAVVEEGPVRQLVSVSGVIKAEDTAQLGFPTSGKVREVLVRKGDTVATGTVLAILDNGTLTADYSDALASLKSAEADLSELVAGARHETKDVSNETVILKQTLLKNTEASEQIKVTNARKLLLSSSLTAYSNQADEEATAPTITGSYICNNEGQYRLEMFRSGTDSGYSFKLSGLESGTYTASFDQPIGFGNCGLRAQFSPTSTYGNSVWLIDIPNKKSSAYVTNKNAYDLAKEQADSAIALAKQELALAEATAINNVAEARPEEILRAQAQVEQARARLERVNIEINNRSLKAPFSGVITSVDVLPGETVTTSPVITLLSAGRFELTARIPEIDIGKLSVGQKAEVIFDTKTDDVLVATIDYVSPNATTIEGVSYYETRLVLDSEPNWLRSGLNADIDIIVSETSNDLRLPRRFIAGSDGSYSVLLKDSTGNYATTTIEVIVIGNDGFVSLRGLQIGDTVIAP